MKAKYIRAIDNNDVVSVRLFLANELMLDPRGKSFSDIKNLAESRIVNLYEPHDGKTYSEDPSKWNEDVLFEIKNDLDVNFSKERLAVYEDVAKKVLKSKAEQLDKEESDQVGASYSEDYNSVYSDERDPSRSNRRIYSGVTAAGAAVTVLGVCVSKGVVAAIGVLGLAVGGIMWYNESKK